MTAAGTLDGCRVSCRSAVLDMSVVSGALLLLLGTKDLILRLLIAVCMLLLTQAFSVALHLVL